MATANEATRLLRSIAASMSRMEEQGSALGLGGGPQRPQAPTQTLGEEIQALMREREMTRLQKERLRITKSEVLESIRTARNREAANKAVVNARKALENLSKTTIQDTASLKSFMRVIQDASRSMSDFSKTDLERVRRNFAAAGRAAEEWGDALAEGPEAVEKLIESTLGQTIAAQDLIRKHEDMVNSLEELRRKNIDTKAEEARLQREMLMEMNDFLSETTGQVYDNIGDASNALQRRITQGMDEAQQSVGGFSTALSNATAVIHKNNRNFGLFGDRMRELANNPLVKVGGAALGANVLLNRGGDGSSIISDYFSTLTTGVDAPWLQSTNTAAALNTSITELKQAILQQGGGGNLTSDAMGQMISRLSGQMGPMTGDYQAAIAAAGGSEQLRARLMQELRNAAITGGDQRGSFRAAEQMVMAGRVLESAGLGTRERFAELSDEIQSSSDMFAALAVRGIKGTEGISKWTMSFVSSMGEIGVSSDQAVAAFKRAAAMRDQTFQQRTQGLGDSMAAMVAGGVDRNLMVAYQRAVLTNNTEEIARISEMAKKQMAGTIRSNAGSTRGMAIESIIAERGGAFGTVSEILGDGTRASDREANISPEQRQAFSEIQRMSADGVDTFAALRDATKEFESTAFALSNYIDGLRQNSVVVAGGTILGGLAALVGQAIIGRVLFGGGTGGLISGIIARTSRAFNAAGGMGGRLLGAMGLRSTAAMGSGIAASAAPATVAAGAPAAAPATVAAGAPAAARIGGTMLGRAGSVVGRAAGPLGLGIGGYFSYQDSIARGETTGNAWSRAGGTVVGGGLGMWGGAATGAAIGSVVPVVGTAIGGIIGAALGAYFGGQAGDSIGDSLYDSFGSEEDARVVNDTTDMGDRVASRMMDVRAEIERQGIAVTSEIQTSNKHLAALVGLTAAKNIPDPVARARALTRIYRTDTRLPV